MLLMKACYLMNDELKELIINWYNNRARNEQEPYFKFLCLWICFNAWLEHESTKSTDRAMIDWLKGAQSNTSELWASYEVMLKTTTGEQNVINLMNSCPIGGSRGAPVIINSSTDSDNIIESIYRIRCNLFHGGKAEGSSRDEKLVTYANNILSKWISDLISKWQFHCCTLE